MLTPIVLGALLASSACQDADDEEAASAFKSFEPAASDPSFSDPRDAVPLDNGAIAFIARANGTNARGEEAPEVGTRAAVVDRYALFVIDAPKAPPRVVQGDLVAPFNLASNGKDKIWIADTGGGAAGTGAILEMSIGGGAMTTLAEEFQPQGVATDKDGKVFFTGKDPRTGARGVFALDGSTPVAVGGQLKSPSGLDVADDGAIYVADPTAAMDLDDGEVSGAGHGVVFKIDGGAVSVVAAGFDAGFPTGIAIGRDGRLFVSAYKDRAAQSAILVIDPAKPKQPTVVSDKLEQVFASAGLHRSRATGHMAWSGGDTVYLIQP